MADFDTVGEVLIDGVGDPNTMYWALGLDGHDTYRVDLMLDQGWPNHLDAEWQAHQMLYGEDGDRPVDSESDDRGVEDDS